MSAIIHCIGRTNPDWEECIEGFCKSMGIDISWYKDLDNYNPVRNPSFIIWRASKLTAQDKINISLRMIKSPLVVFSYIDQNTMPNFSKSIVDSSIKNGAAGFFTISYTYEEFVKQMKSINLILKLKWLFIQKEK